MVATSRSWLLILCFTIARQMDCVHSATTTYKVTTIFNRPFIMEPIRPGNTKYDGFLIDVLEELKKSLNVDFDIDLVADGRYGSVTEEGNWTGMVGHLERGEADIAAAPLHLTSMRAKTIEYTVPYMLAGPQILVKTPPGLTMSKFFMLLQPFSTTVWITALVGYVVVSLALYVIWRWSPFEWGSISTERDVRDSFSLQNSFLYAFSTMLWQGYSVTPRSFSGRFLSAIWWIFAMFFLVAYIASLTGRFIIKDSLTPVKIHTFDDLALSNIRYGVIKGGRTYQLFKSSKNPIRQQMFRQMEANPADTPLTIGAGIQKVRRSSGDYAFIMETPMAEYEASKEPCDLYVTGEPLTDDAYAFACKKGAGICSELSHALLALKETARLHDLRRKWFGGVCSEKNALNTKSPFVSPKTTFTLEDAAFAFLLLGLGIIISLVAFGLEIFLDRKGIVKPSVYKGDEMRIHEPIPEV
ncbi:glutamate receptor U1-like [Liolophura sinensis]|uniref:glutamate receptor U1-like n=1 Tax=Liolophura sinensis TaxID=3198878 RepID=UPI0031586335